MTENLPERYEPQQALDFLERASGQLALILDPVDAARFVRQAEMIEYLTRKVKAAEGVQRQAAEIVVRSNRRLGELLAQTERATGSRGSFKKSNDGRSEARPPARPALSDLGIPKQKAAEAQKLAAIPEAEFEHHVTTAPRPTVHGVIAAAEPSKPSEPSAVALVRSLCQAVAAITPTQFLAVATPTQREVVLAFAREMRAVNVSPPVATKTTGCAHTKTRISPTTGLRLCEDCGDIVRR